MSKCDKYKTPVGEKVRKTYTGKVEDDGNITLIESGKEDWYGFIQSFKDSVDIHVILKKCLNGDMSGLAKVQGFYADSTEFPKTKPEMLQVMIDAERNFNMLPKEIKAKFDYDVKKFISTMDQPEWLDKIGVKREPIKEEIPDEEVKE